MENSNLTSLIQPLNHESMGQERLITTSNDEKQRSPRSPRSPVVPSRKQSLQSQRKQALQSFRQQPLKSERKQALKSERNQPLQSEQKQALQSFLQQPIKSAEKSPTKSAEKKKSGHLPELLAGGGKGSHSMSRGFSIKIPSFKLKRSKEEKKIVFGQEIDGFPSYDIWLEPIDEEDNLLKLDPREYTTFKRCDNNLPMTILVGMILISFFAVRGSFTTLWYLNFEYVIGFLAGCIFVVGMIISIVFRLSLLSYDYVILERLQPLYKFAETWTQQVKGHLLEDTIMISLAIATGMYVLARSLVGECPDLTNRWDIQNCNPQHGDQMVPTDTLVLDLLSPLVVQKFFTGASKRGVYISWSIILTLVNVSLFCVHAAFDSYLWVNLQFLLVMTISYEIERGFISRFMGKKLEETANDKNAALIFELELAKRCAMESDMTSKRTMIRYINNEIRAPLNTIAGSTEALLLELKAMKKLINPQIIEIVMTTRENCAVVADVISDLLSFDKISSGTFRIEVSPVAILNYVLELARPFVASARSKGVEFTFEKFHCTDQIMVQIDPVKMGQVVRNIFLNAVNFTESGQILVTLMTHKRENGESLVTISVKDSGSGLSRFKLLQLFDDRIKFNTIGSGLGLYVSKEIIKLHKGASLWAESEGEGKGSTFFIQIVAVDVDVKGEWDVDIDPIDANSTKPSSKPSNKQLDQLVDGPIDISVPDPNEHRNSVDHRSPPNGQIGSVSSNEGKTQNPSLSASRGNLAGMIVPSSLMPPLRVLVVDDSKLHRKTLTRMLTMDKHVVAEASNGLEAFAQIRRMFIVRDGVINDTSEALVFDAIVMDNNMPKMSGTDAALEIRRVGYMGPIIGIVGDPDCLEKYKQNGADEVLIKPVNRQKLAATLRDVLDKKKGLNNEQNHVLAHLHGKKDVSHSPAAATSLEQDRRHSRSAQRRQSRVTSVNVVSRGRLLQSSNRSPEDETRGRMLQSSNRSPEDESREPGKKENSQEIRFVSSKSNRIRPPEYNRNMSSHSQDKEHSANRNQSMIVGGLSHGAPRHNQVAPITTGEHALQSGESLGENDLHSFDGSDMDMEAIRMDVSRYTDVMLNLKGKIFNNEEIQLEYKDFRRSNLNFKLGVVCLIITTIFVATRFSLEHLWFLNSTFAFVFFCYCAFMICIMISFFFKFVGLYSYDWPLLQRCHGVWLLFYNSGVAYVIDDGIIIFVSLATSFDMLARVLQGPCPMYFSMWYQQQCNPEAISNAVPQETLIFMTFSIIVWQVFINASSRGSIAFSWLIVIVLLNVNLYLVKSNLYLWHNLGFVWLIAVSYELERFQITTFIYQRLLVVANSHRQLVESSNSQLNNERDMYVSVSDELRNTISNAAHDLTSPCAAVGLAVESVLKIFLTQALAQNSVRGGNSLALQDNKDHDHVMEVLWDVYYAMMTLHMIINRATDYNKIVTGVKLVACPRPVDIRECIINVIHSCGTLRVVGSVRRIDSTTSSLANLAKMDNDDDAEGNDIAPLHDPGVIALSSISDDIPDEIMTDVSWLRDNLICVIGNAVKYSVGSVLINVKTVSSGGHRMLEIDVQDSGPDKLSSMQLKALFDRPIQFAREHVGGMGVGLFCLGERCKALGGDSGARLRLDNKSGTVVWFRIPLEKCSPGQKATKSELFILKEQQLELHQQQLSKSVHDELNKILSRSESKQIARGPQEMPSLSPLKEAGIKGVDRLPSILPGKASKGTPDGSLRGSPRGSPRGSASRPGSLKTPGIATAAATAPAVGVIGRKLSNNDVTNVIAIRGTLAVATGPLTGLHILAVDDSAAILKMMVRMLAGAGAIVTSAKDGREAVSLAERTAFNVVVTDIQMPHLDGFGEAKQIRKIEERLKNTPNERVPAIIVGISAKSDPKCHADALEAGMNSFVAKPFRLQELIEIMARNPSKRTVGSDHSPIDAPMI